MISIVLAAAAVTLAVNVVDVQSGTGCPSSEDVAAKLRPLLGAESTGAGDRARVEMLESGEGDVARLRVYLMGSDGSLVGDRQLILDGTCSEKADAVAAVIVAWDADVVATSSMVDLGAAAAPSLEVSAKSRDKQPGRVAVVGISGGAALIGGTAATGSLEALVGKPTSRWQMRLAVTGETVRRRGLDLGQITWRHTTATTGLMLRSRGPAWRFCVDGGLFIGWVTLSGEGYSPGRQAASLDFGVAGALRLERALGRSGLWVEGRGWVRPRTQDAVLNGPPDRVRLSHVDAMFSLGGSIPLFR